MESTKLYLELALDKLEQARIKGEITLQRQESCEEQIKHMASILVDAALRKE